MTHPYTTPQPELVAALQKAVAQKSHDQVRRLTKTSPGAFKAVLEGRSAPSVALADIADYLDEEGLL